MFVNVINQSFIMKPAVLQRVTAAMVAVVLVSSFTGCGKGEPEPTAAPVQPAADPNAGQVAVTPVATAPGTPPPPIDVSAPPPMTATAPAVAAAESDVPSKDALEAVTHALQSFSIAHERAPKSLEELISSGYLRKLPPPPAGKKYVYVPEINNISLADQ